jgi:hypothetical protein
MKTTESAGRYTTPSRTNGTLVLPPLEYIFDFVYTGGTQTDMCNTINGSVRTKTQPHHPSQHLGDVPRLQWYVCDEPVHRAYAKIFSVETVPIFGECQGMDIEEFMNAQTSV